MEKLKPLKRALGIVALLLVSAASAQAANVGDRLEINRAQLTCIDLGSPNKRPCAYCYRYGYGDYDYEQVSLSLKMPIDGVQELRATTSGTCADIDAGFATLKKPIGVRVVSKLVDEVNANLTTVRIGVRVDSVYGILFGNGNQ